MVARRTACRVREGRHRRREDGRSPHLRHRPAHRRPPQFHRRAADHVGVVAGRPEDRHVDEDPEPHTVDGDDRVLDGLGAVDSIPIASSSIRLNQWSAQGRDWWPTTPTPHALFLNVEGADRRRVRCTIRPWSRRSRCSPDGRFVAGVRGQLRDFHVFVTSVSGPPGRWQISPSKASRPKVDQRADGIVFETSDGKLMAVSPRRRARDSTWGRRSCCSRCLDLVVDRPERVDGGRDQIERFVVSAIPTDQRSFEVMTDFRSLVTRKVASATGGVARHQSSKSATDGPGRSPRWGAIGRGPRPCAARAPRADRSRARRRLPSRGRPREHAAVEHHHALLAVPEPLHCDQARVRVRVPDHHRARTAAPRMPRARFRVGRRDA